MRVTDIAIKVELSHALPYCMTGTTDDLISLMVKYEEIKSMFTPRMYYTYRGYHIPYNGVPEGILQVSYISRHPIFFVYKEILEEGTFLEREGLFVWSFSLRKWLPAPVCTDPKVIT